MARYHFVSRLTPEQMQIRLSVYARPADHYGWQFEKDGFYYRFYKRTSFFLVKIPPREFFGKPNGQPVFLAKLTEKDGLTYLDGDFGTERRELSFVLLFLSLFFVFAECVLAPGMLLFSLPLAAGWFYLASRIWRAIAANVYREERKAVIELIEDRLLS